MPKKFNFELESVLNIKKFKQNLLRQDLAKLQEALDREQKLQYLMEFSLKQAKGFIRENLAEWLSQTSLNYQHYIRHMMQKIDDQDKKIAAIEQVIAQKRSQIKEAAKEKKVLEKLKARQKYEYVKKLNSKLQKNLDETALLKFVQEAEVTNGIFNAN
ncbi:MAG: flagellar export protein FliJ [Actinomycetota bacterium]|jgi:flagellar FliJ protein|nr:flagellar export protein FliJ [Actinomycetota bacterium]